MESTDSLTKRKEKLHRSLISNGKKISHDYNTSVGAVGRPWRITGAPTHHNLRRTVQENANSYYNSSSLSNFLSGQPIDSALGDVGGCE